MQRPHTWKAIERLSGHLVCARCQRYYCLRDCDKGGHADLVHQVHKAKGSEAALAFASGLTDERQLLKTMPDHAHVCRLQHEGTVRPVSDPLTCDAEVG